jgi:hypothetical protein
MDKKVLAIYYSQTGQQASIMEKVLSPLRVPGVTVETVQFEMKERFGFPWSSASFFDAMPESVMMKPAAIETPNWREQQYDLIILGYQPWFLSPSIPANSIVQDPAFRKLLRDTPVITVIGARNMWLNAQEKMKGLLAAAGAKLVGNIAEVDHHSNPVSAITILYWMFSGRKDRMWGIFPEPGVSQQEIDKGALYGGLILDALRKNDFGSLQPALAAAGAVIPKPSLMFVEHRAGKLFPIWANLVVKKKNRKAWLVVFKYYLIFALFILAPILLTIYTLFFRPFLGASIARRKAYFAGVQQNA